ncbi:hypothetical protein ACLBXM_19855 [Xanthobacteraceae bacterium A53D]
MSLAAQFERWAPLFAGSIALSLTLLLREAAVNFIAEYKISISQLITGIFGWASVMTGYIFGVYGIIIGKSDGFVQKIKETKSMSRFLGFVSTCLFLGILLTLLGIPLLVVDMSSGNITKFSYIASSIYFGIFVWSLAACFRVAIIFYTIMRVKAISRLPP